MTGALAVGPGAGLAGAGPVGPDEDAVVPIATVAARDRVTVRGRVRSIRVRPWADTPTLELVLVDETGGIVLTFLSRRRLGGVALGRTITAEGVATVHQRRLAILNPSYRLHAP